MNPLFAATIAILFAALSTSCSPDYLLVSNPNEQGGESEAFGYRTWRVKNVEPDLVVIGIHGFCGASIDYSNLGNFLIKAQPKTAVYAYEVRGQGSDPIEDRRGDIGKAEEWYQDLEAFTQLVTERHPKAKIVWFGESMGAMIATHAITAAPRGKPPCDGLILSSPLVRFKDEIEPWKVALARSAAATLPNARISLDALSGSEDVQMTQESIHSDQAKGNSYNVEAHTLRLLGTLATLIDGMNGCASQLEVPTLVLHGGKDYFNNDSDLRGFVARIPSSVPSTYKNYPDAYHLLMYDEQKEKIFGDVARWLNDLR